jgi:catechol 2,3-dioxygenase-like lactoylglutathione lyase family enzyme
MSVKLGVVGHFGLAVRDPERSAKFWTSNFNLEELFRFDGGIAVGNDAVTIALFKGTPDPTVLDHMSFHLQSVEELQAALAALKKNGVNIEDPGDEIGPEAPGSAHLGLWFHDPDDYRWELSVQNALRTKR